jgi:hypothetical protein
MKRLVFAAIALSASSAFALSTPKVSPGVGSGRLAPTTVPGVTAPGVSAVSGAGAITSQSGVGASALGNQLITSVNVVSSQELGASCKTLVGLSSADKAVLAEARALRVTGGSGCLEKFAEDSTVLTKAVAVTAAGVAAAKSLGLKDVNGDGKADLADATTLQMGTVLGAQAKQLGGLNSIDAEVAAGNLESTVANTCDLLDPSLASSAAFAAAL